MLADSIDSDVACVLTELGCIWTSRVEILINLSSIAADTDVSVGTVYDVGVPSAADNIPVLLHS